jgi:hypothetical protein
MTTVWTITNPRKIKMVKLKVSCFPSVRRWPHPFDKKIAFGKLAIAGSKLVAHPVRKYASTLTEASVFTGKPNIYLIMGFHTETSPGEGN